MTYTYIRREATLEQELSNVMADGAAFAEMCAWRADVPKGPGKRVFMHMISRLQNGEVLDPRDDGCIKEVGGDLIARANGMRTGYGDFLINSFRHEPLPLSVGLAHVHKDIMLFDQFHSSRCRVRRRMAARTQLAALE